MLNQAIQQVTFYAAMFAGLLGGLSMLVMLIVPSMYLSFAKRKLDADQGANVTGNGFEFAIWLGDR